MARTTLSTTNARIDSLESKLDKILAHLEPKAPAKTVTRVKTAAGTKKSPTLLRKANRRAFVASAAKEGYDFEGWSTRAIAAFCVETAYCPKGWAIGAGYVALVS